MILGYTNEEIVKKAVEYQSEITDGVVQYDYKTGKLFGAGFTTGTIENPANPFIEVFRLPQGERGEINYDCDECWTNDGTVAMKCCMEAYIDEYFEDDFEDNFKESVENQIRDVLSDYLSNTISKLNEIRIDIADLSTPWEYWNVRQDNWEMNVLDSYVDDALENGFSVDTDPLNYLDAEYQHITEIIRYKPAGTSEEEKLFGKIAQCLIDRDLDGALELL